MIISKYYEKDGKMYVEASDYDKILYELKNSNEEISKLESELESKVSEIESLKKQIEKLASIRMRCHESARDSFDNGNYGALHIVTADELKNDDKVKELQCELDKTYNELMEVEKQAQEKIAELESELEVRDNLLKIKNGLLGNDETKEKEPIEIATDIIRGRNKDDLEQIAQHIQVYCRHIR